MCDKQEITSQSENENSSNNTIGQDIFVPPVMSSETRGESDLGAWTRSASEGVKMIRTTYTKDEDV